MIISNMRCTCLVLCNVDRNDRETIVVQGGKLIRHRGDTSTHLKGFSTRLGDQRMPSALGRGQAPAGRHPFCTDFTAKDFNPMGFHALSMPQVTCEGEFCIIPIAVPA